MKAYDEEYDTPIYAGRKVNVVVGGGNVGHGRGATQASSGGVREVYRRSEAELPARVEEVHHAKQEGIDFPMLTKPTEITGERKGMGQRNQVRAHGAREPDATGRRSPGQNRGQRLSASDCDVVIMALGTSPNAHQVHHQRSRHQTARAASWPTKRDAPRVKASSPEATP